MSAICFWISLDLDLSFSSSSFFFYVFWFLPMYLDLHVLLAPETDVSKLLARFLTPWGARI
jgi:hypothetical protein